MTDDEYMPECPDFDTWLAMQPPMRDGYRPDAPEPRAEGCWCIGDEHAEGCPLDDGKPVGHP